MRTSMRSEPIKQQLDRGLVGCCVGIKRAAEEERDLCVRDLGCVFYVVYRTRLGWLPAPGVPTFGIFRTLD